MEKAMNMECLGKKICRLISFLMSRAKKFSCVDYAAFKLCLITAGVLVGARFHKFFKLLSPALNVLFAISYIYLIWRIFFAKVD